MDIFKTDLFRWRWVGVATFRSNFLTFHLHLPSCLPEKGMGSTHVLTLNFNSSPFSSLHFLFLLICRRAHRKNNSSKRTSLCGVWKETGVSWVRVVYFSCRPALFVRDLRIIQLLRWTHTFSFYEALFVCLFVSMVVCLFVCLSLCIIGCLFVCLSLCIIGCLFVCLFVSMSLCLFTLYLFTL